MFKFINIWPFKADDVKPVYFNFVHLFKYILGLFYYFPISYRYQKFALTSLIN